LRARIQSLLVGAFLLAMPGVDVTARGLVDMAGVTAAFQGARELDLRTSKVSSVVALRDVIKIPPPSQSVLVKTFRRSALPEALKPAFARPEVSAVTIGGRFVAIIHTDLASEYEDVLRHELVHAYITLASPKPLPFWFQEGSAVYFSTGKARKFYGQASTDHPGMIVGKTVELDPVYKQKLHSFQYMVQTAGDERFRKWFRRAVVSGQVDARTLTGEPKASAAPLRDSQRPLPVWLMAAIGVVVVVVMVIGFHVSRRDRDYY